jgi:ribosomal protein L31E
LAGLLKRRRDDSCSARRGVLRRRRRQIRTVRTSRALSALRAKRKRRGRKQRYVRLSPTTSPMLWRRGVAASSASWARAYQSVPACALPTACISKRVSPIPTCVCRSHCPSLKLRITIGRVTVWVRPTGS